LKVLAVEFDLNRIKWSRFVPQFRAISEHVELQVMHCGDFTVKEFPEIKMPVPRLDTMAHLYESVGNALDAADDFDVLYFRNGGPRSQLFNTMLKELADRPAVMKVGGLNSEVRKYHYFPDAHFQDALDDVTLAAVDLLVPMCSRIAGVLRERGLTRISEPVPEGIDTEMFSPSKYPERFTVGYAGRISPEKGMDFLGAVMRATPDIQYEMVGPIEMVDYRFPPNCHYCGAWLYEDMPKFYRRVSLVVLPSYTEGLSNVVLEACASGRPIMVSDVPSELPVFNWKLLHDMDAWVQILKLMSTKSREDLKGFTGSWRDWLKDNWPSWSKFGLNMAENLKSVHRPRAMMPNDDRPVIGWVGNYNIKSKNYGLAMQVINSLGYRVKVAGPKGSPHFIKHEKMPEFYRSLDALLVTSEFEAHPLIVYEALACGIPVAIEYGVGDCWRESVPCNYYGLPVKDTVELAIQQALYIPYRERIALADYIKQNWTWNKFIDKYVEMFNFVVKKPLMMRILIAISERNWAWDWVAQEIQRFIVHPDIECIDIVYLDDYRNPYQFGRWDCYDVILNHVWERVNGMFCMDYPDHKSIVSVNGPLFRDIPDIFKKVVDRSPCVTTVSKALVSELEAYGKPVFHCSRGVDTEVFHP